jgi:hypothetical protein
MLHEQTAQRHEDDEGEVNDQDCIGEQPVPHAG